MAKRLEWGLMGVDVSKAELSIRMQDRAGVETLPNERKVIRSWLKTLPGPMRIAVEATNTFHLALVEEAHAQGHTVFVVDGYRLNRYRESIGGRAKTDRTDAELLLRYLEREAQDLRPWSPPPLGYVTLHRLLHRRAAVVQARTSLGQSLADLPELKSATRAMLQRLNDLDRLIRKRIAQALRDSGAAADAARCQGIEGIGPITAAALANAFRRGAFSSSDAFVAFFGLDVRVRESGTYKGQRRLTKQGDPEIRRLLHNAAMSAIKSPRWKPIYERYLQRGLKRIQVLVIVARKLARIAFALMKNQSDYQPSITVMA
jgi:transposase